MAYPPCIQCGQLITNDYGPLYCFACWSRLSSHGWNSTIHPQPRAFPSPLEPQPAPAPVSPTQTLLPMHHQFQSQLPKQLPVIPPKQQTMRRLYEVQRVASGPCEYCGEKKSFVQVWVKIIAISALTLTEVVCFECYVKHFHKKF